MVTFREQVPATSAATAPTALLLPGAGYTAQAPLLYWTTAALLAHGWRILTADWGEPPESLNDGRARVRDSLDQFTDEVPDLIVAKSIGTFSLPWAVENAVPGVWLTPLLSEPDVVDALGAADNRHIAIGGTADPYWVPAAVAGTHAVLHSVPGANHSLELADAEWMESAKAQFPLIELAVNHAIGVGRAGDHT